MNLIDKTLLRKSLIFILFLELISFFSWLLPDFGNIAYIIILIGILMISLWDLRYGVGILLAELIIGSHGYLFAFGPGDVSISIRLGIFLVLMTVFIYNLHKDRKVELYYSKLFWPWVFLIFAVIFSSLRGVVLGNELSDVFFDMNAFIFLGLALPIWQAFKTRKDLFILWTMGLAALIMSIVKVFFVLYVFSHKMWWMLVETYQWVRDTRIGEITMITDIFYRVFFQSQIYTIMGFIFAGVILAAILKENKLKDIYKSKIFLGLSALSIATLASILVSFSRSNWVGMFAAFILLPIFLFLAYQISYKHLLNIIGVGFASLVLSLGLVSVVVLFPYPNVDGEFAAGSLLSKRALTFKGEAGVSSRWQLLPPLWQSVQDNPVLGAGFGKTVTYKTEDPRILAQNPTGEYTTFAFEWGYLDLWLKFGLIGLVVYAIFALKIFWQNIQLIRFHKSESSEYQETTIALSLLLGGIVVLATHTFSPYLNHPLGIGYLLFWGMMVERLWNGHKSLKI